MTMKLPLIALGCGVMAALAAPAHARIVPFAPLHGEEVAGFLLRDSALHAAAPHGAHNSAAQPSIQRPSPNLLHAPAHTPE